MTNTSLNARLERRDQVPCLSALSSTQYLFISVHIASSHAMLVIQLTCYKLRWTLSVVNL